MDERNRRREREAALVNLLDDPSPVVQAAIREEIGRLSLEHLQFMRVIAQDRTHRLSMNARRLLDDVLGPQPDEQLLEFIRRQIYDLETGMYLINRVVNPAVSLSAVRSGLDGLAMRCRALLEPGMLVPEVCKRMNRVLFHEASFRGNISDYENPHNSCIDAVLQHRQGLPITLSVIYLLVGQRLDLILEPIGFPGHFMVGCYSEEFPFFIDPFERGRFLTLEELRGMLLKRNVVPDLHYFAPVPVAEVLCRVCRNLVYHFDQRNELKWANRFRGFVREFEAQYNHSGTEEL